MRNNNADRLLASRRATLRSVAAGSLSLLGTGITSGRGEKVVEIPKYQSHGEVIAWQSVSRSWFERTKLVDEVVDDLCETFLRTPEVEAVEQVPGDKLTKNYRTGKVVVRAKSDIDKVRAAVPESIDNVPISVEPAMKLHDTTVLEGGMSGGAFDNEATLTSKVTYGGSTRIMTARHMFTESGRCDPTLDNNAAYSDDEKFGVVTDDWQSHDVAIADARESDFEIGSGIYNQPGYIDGAVAKKELQRMRDEYDYSVRKYGQKSQLTTGERVIGLSTTITCDISGSEDLTDLVLTSDAQFGGDSGAPRYVEEYIDDLNQTVQYIIGPATQKNSDGNAVGAGAYKLENQESIYF
ncbi:hypothetical protein [Halorussus halophilus]|uniref:hypothetical protein n=1 Tax=Halorussus halophilus TaxID=2650975 RepID=UPI001787E56B|nr:hypothetical protein [Halorussus halophilus]